MFKTKSSKYMVFSFAFTVLMIFGVLLIKNYSQNKKDYYLKVQSDLLLVKYESSYKYLNIMADDVFLMYQNNKKLVKLLSQANKETGALQSVSRQDLYRLLLKNYKRLNHMGITQVHFVLPNNISFLRMYNPQLFGDNVSGNKPATVATNKDHKPHHGFEACRFMLGERFTYPLFDKKHYYLGSVEIAYSTRELLRNVTDEFVHDNHILVSKEIAKGTIIEEELNQNYITSLEDTSYYIEESTHKHIGGKNLYKELYTVQAKEDVRVGIRSQKAFSVVSNYNYQNIILSFLPLSSSNGNKNIAYIVTYTESDYLSNLKIQTNYVLALFMSIISLFYIFGLYVISAQSKLKELALYDNLTKLPNRALFMIEFNNEVNRALRYKHNIALLFLDLDGFKAVNDTYGHQIGDELLIHIANTITSRLRKNDTVSRLGGDEFTVILNDIKDASKAVEIAKLMIEDINKDIVINHEVLHVGASIGIGMYPGDAEEIEKLIQYADKMMYLSKERGKNRVTLYEDEK